MTESFQAKPLRSVQYRYAHAGCPHQPANATTAVSLNRAIWLLAEITRFLRDLFIGSTVGSAGAPPVAERLPTISPAGRTTFITLRRPDRRPALHSGHSKPAATTGWQRTGAGDPQKRVVDRCGTAIQADDIEVPVVTDLKISCSAGFACGRRRAVRDHGCVERAICEDSPATSRYVTA